MVRRPTRSAPLFCTIDFSSFGMAMLLVIFVLLTFEMIYSPGPLCTFGPSEDLPRAYHASKMRRANREDAMIVTITRDGKVFFGSDPVESKWLPQLIRERLNAGTENKVYLKLDRNARNAIVDRVLAEISAANIYKVAFLVEQWQPPVPPPPSPE